MRAAGSADEFDAWICHHAGSGITTADNQFG
jgi:hypothetical protein